MKKYNTGKHEWEYNQVVDYTNRRPSRWLLGPCPRCGMITSTYGGGFNCHTQYCRNSASVFSHHTADEWPDWWNTDIDVKLDGNAWCATGSGFVNLQESDAGFGETPSDAVRSLREAVDSRMAKECADAFKPLTTHQITP